MIEPPRVGFTGVVWEARSAERITRELTTGPGATPMAEAGAAWERLSAVFAAAAVEYPRIMTGLRGAWTSGAADATLSRIAELEQWFSAAAAAAAANAAAARGQAVAHDLARLAMPSPVEIQAVEAALRSLSQVGAGLGLPLDADVAKMESSQDHWRNRAARVMQTYEATATPLSAPADTPRPPRMAGGASSAVTPAPTATPAAPRTTPTASYGTIPTLRAHQAFRAPVAAAEMSRMAPVSQPCASTAAAAAPLGPVSATGVVRDDDSAVRPAAGAGGGVGPDFLALDAAAAPPVLGALAGPAVPGVAP